MVPVARIGTAFIPIEGDFDPLFRQIKANLPKIKAELDAITGPNIEGSVDVDTTRATEKIDKLGSETVTVKGNFDLDTTAATAKIELLKREAAGIGGGIGGGVGGFGGGGSGSSGIAKAGFIASNPILTAIAAGLPLLPTVGSSLLQGALGAGALGTAGAGAAGVGFGSIFAAAKPAVAALGNVTNAQTALNTAIRTYGKNSTEAKTATEELQAAQSQLPKSGEQVATSLQDIQSRWRQLSLPAQNTFFKTLQDGLSAVNAQLPMFANVASKSMTAARGAFDDFLGVLDSQDFHAFVQTMTVTFVKSVGPLEQAFQNLARILMRIAVAAAPSFVRMAKSFREMTRDWLDSTDNAHKLRQEVNGLVGQFKDWLRLIGAIGNVLGELFLANTRGADAGGNAIKKLTHTLNGWADWISHNHKPVNDFFINLLHTVEILGKAIGNLAKSIAPISDAFVPISNAILKITTALNSLKVGNVSALTVLLGAMVARSAAGRFPAIFGPAGSAAGGAGAGGLLARLGAGSRLAGGAIGGGAIAGGLLIIEGGRGDVQQLKQPGVSPLDRIGSGLRDIGSGPLGLQGKGLGDLLGLPKLGDALQGGSPLGAMIGELHHFQDAAEAVTHPARTLGNVINTAKDGFHAITHPIDTAKGALNDITHPLDTVNTLFGSSSDAAKPAAAAIAKFAAQVHGGNRAVLAMQKQIGGLSTKSASDAIASLKDHYGSLVNAGANMSAKQRQVWIDIAIQAQKSGDITQNQLQQLTHAFTNSSQKVQDQMKAAAKVTGQSTQSIANSVGDAAVHVSRAYDGMVKVVGGGLTWLTSNTSKAAQALGVKQQINFHTTPSHVQGTVGNEHLAGLASGGMLVPGAGAGDKVPLSIGGRLRAMIEPGEIVHVLNRNAAKHMQALNEAVPRFAKGGMFRYPFAKGMPLGRVDEGIDAAVPGAPIGAIGNATVTSMTNAFAPSFGSSNQGMVYKLTPPPKGYAPSSPYVYIYEGLDKVGGIGRSLKAGQLLGHIHASYPGIEMGWAAGPAGPALAHGHYSEGQQTAEGLSFTRFIKDLASGKAVGGAAAAQQLKRLLLHGPNGGWHLRDTGQAALDKVWKAGNAYLAKHQPKASALMGGVGTFPATKGGWHRVGATYEGLDGQQGAYGTVGGMGFAELLLAGANAGMHPNLEDVLGTKIPPLGKVGFKMPGSNKMATAVKNDIGSGQPGSGHYLVDIQTGLAKAIGWHPNEDVLVKAMRGGGVVPWYGNGADFIANRPQLIGVGDGGPERVRVGPPSGDDVHVHNHVYFDDPSLRDLIRVESSVEYDERAGLSQQEARMR